MNSKPASDKSCAQTVPVYPPSPPKKETEQPFDVIDTFPKYEKLTNKPVIILVQI